jgi:hypothetical protein
MTTQEEIWGDGEQWRWCLHCERAYPASRYRTEVSKGIDGETVVLKMCPYEGCGGSTYLDGWHWSEIRRANPSYPREPVEGVVYPLYPT